MSDTEMPASLTAWLKGPVVTDAKSDEYRNLLTIRGTLADGTQLVASGDHRFLTAVGWQHVTGSGHACHPGRHLTVDETLLAIGRAVYKDKCQRCHGPGGLGDGPDADPDHEEDMDLTNPKRAARNSDGVVFYKVSNGRRRPKMPPFKEELTEQQIWAVVAYAQSLRKK